MQVQTTERSISALAEKSVGISEVLACTIGHFISAETRANTNTYIAPLFTGIINRVVLVRL